MQLHKIYTKYGIFSGNKCFWNNNVWLLLSKLFFIILLGKIATNVLNNQTINTHYAKHVKMRSCSGWCIIPLEGNMNAEDNCKFVSAVFQDLASTKVTPEILSNIVSIMVSSFSEMNCSKYFQFLATFFLKNLLLVYGCFTMHQTRKNGFITGTST